MRDVTCASTSRTAHPVDNVAEVSTTTRTVLERFPAGSPRGSWPAEEFAAARRTEGTPAQVVMDLKSDAFLVVTPGGDQ